MPARHGGPEGPHYNVNDLLAQPEHAQRQTRDRGHVLLAVDLVGDRAADDLPAEARLPQQRAGARVERLEVALAAAGEQQVATPSSGCRCR